MTATVLTPAGVLDAAADWIAENPSRWGQGDYIAGDGCRCALGAIAYVLDPSDGLGNPTQLPDRDKTDLAVWVIDVFAHHLMDHHGAPLADDLLEAVALWNDDEVSDPAEVVDAFREAAQEWRDRQAARTARAVTA